MLMFPEQCARVVNFWWRAGVGPSVSIALAPISHKISRCTAVETGLFVAFNIFLRQLISTSSHYKSPGWRVMIPSSALPMRRFWSIKLAQGRGGSFPPMMRTLVNHPKAFRLRHLLQYCLCRLSRGSKQKVNLEKTNPKMSSHQMLPDL